MYCTCVFLSFDVTIGDALAAIERNIWAERERKRETSGEKGHASGGPMSGDTDGEAKLDAAEEKVHQKLVQVCRGCLLLFSKLESHPIGNPLDP